MIDYIKLKSKQKINPGTHIITIFFSKVFCEPHRYLKVYLTTLIALFLQLQPSFIRLKMDEEPEAYLLTDMSSDVKTSIFDY